MIIFHCVRWKNFLSFGNAFTEVVLDEHDSTLITGENGAGKSTLLDAICFALYGKSFRNVGKWDLVNSVNKKGMEVELEFSVGNKRYKISRTAEPSRFNIYCNDTEVMAGATVAEHQKLLEEQVLKIKFATFKQVVLLGSATHIPFMTLEKWQRRNIVEDLLDIQIFGVMNDLLQVRKRTNETSLKDVGHQKQMTEQKISLVQSSLDGLKKQRDDFLGQQQDKINDNKNKIEQLRTDNEKIVGEVSDLNANPDRIDSINDLLYKFKTNIKEYNRQIDFFHDTDDCPTCQQGLSHEIKDSKISEYKGKVEEQSGALTKLEEQQSLLQTALDRSNKLNEEIRSNQREIDILKRQVAKLEKESTGIDTSEIDTKATDLEDAKQQLETLVEHHKELVHKKHLFDLAKKLLEDDGIKAQIIKQYIPIINQTTNSYLQKMGLPIKFELDENFKEVVRSRYQDEFKYQSFSMGERQRIDLALLLTWRAIAKSRNSASTNLLVLDETFDSSLDVNGTDELIKILYELTGSNIIVISHKMSGDDKFVRSIEVKKKGNFSTILENF